MKLYWPPAPEVVQEAALHPGPIRPSAQDRFGLGGPAHPEWPVAILHLAPGEADVVVEEAEDR